MKTADGFFRSDDYIPPGGTLVRQCRQTLSFKLKEQHSKSKKTVFYMKTEAYCSMGVEIKTIPRCNFTVPIVNNVLKSTPMCQ